MKETTVRFGGLPLLPEGTEIEIARVYLASGHWPCTYLHCSPIVLLLSLGRYSVLDLNPRGSFKDDIVEMDMNEFGHRGRGPIWNHYIAV